MSKLSEFLNQHFLDKKLVQKDVGRAFHDAHTRLVGSDKALEWKTIEPKLTKLLKGHREGESFFLNDAKRRAAFTRAVGLPEARLMALRSARTLVLDPALPEEPRSYLLARAEEEDAGHHCVELPDEDRGAARRFPRGEHLPRLRDLALENPGCLVVTEDYSAKHTLEFANIKTTQLTKHPLGWLLTAAPELVPLPPPPPPRLFDHDQHPMIAHEAFEIVVRDGLTRNRWGRSGEGLSHSALDSIARRIREVDETASTLTFRLDEIGPWLCAQAELTEVEWLAGTRTHPAAACFLALFSESRRTIVFSHGDGEHLFAVGPDRERLHALIEPHQLKVPACFEAWRTAVETWNPWIALPVDRKRVDRWGRPSSDRTADEKEKAPPVRWATLAREVEAECGLKIADALPLWRERALPAEPSTWPVQLKDGSRAEADLEAIARVLERPFELGVENISRLFRLKALQTSDLVMLPLSERDRAHFVAHLGAGHLLRVRLTEFPSEAPLPITAFSSTDLDGGDVHLVVERLHDDVALEGSPFVARKRRDREQAAAEAEEERRRQDDDD